MPSQKMAANANNEQENAQLLNFCSKFTEKIAICKKSGVSGSSLSALMTRSRYRRS
jgi:hypothetical protein